MIRYIIQVFKAYIFHHIEVIKTRTQINTTIEVRDFKIFHTNNLYKI